MIRERRWRPLPGCHFASGVTDAIFSEMRRDPNRPTSAAIGAALDKLWQSNLKYRVEKRLKTIADTAPQPDQPQPQASRRRLLFR